MKKLLAVLLFVAPQIALSQTVQLIPVPRQVILSNTGTIQPNMVLYVFLAGTTTAASVYTDFTGTVLLSNPVPADSSGRLPQVWATNQLIKLVACAQNDGATCAAGDMLWTADGINAFGGSSSGSSASPFISASPNPATTGILRLASGDTFCYRNAANNANLCFSKNANDLLGWAGGSFLFPEVAAPTGVAASDLFWADSTAHRWKMSNNGGAATQVVASGADISTSDTVTSTHLSSALPVAQGGTGQASLTALPLTNPVINTTSITGTPASANLAAVVASGTVSMPTSTINPQACSSAATATATGATTSDAIEWTFSGSAPPTPQLLQTVSWITSGQVNFEYCNVNPTGGTSSTPGAATVNWKVIR